MLSTLLLVAIFALQSPQVTPQLSGDKGQANQEKPSKGDDKPEDSRGSIDQPLVVRIPKTDLEAQQEQQDRARQTLNHRLTIGLGALTIAVAFMQLRVMSKQRAIAAEQNAIIKNQNTIMQGQRNAADTQSRHMLDTLVETRRSADAAKASVEVLMASNQQWLEVDQWTADVGVNAFGVESATFTCVIKNASNLPLQLKRVEYFSNFDEPDQVKAIVYFYDPVGPGGRYDLKFSHSPSGERWHNYRHGTAFIYKLPVAGRLIFVNSFGKEQTQVFGTGCVFRVGLPSVFSRLNWPTEHIMSELDKAFSQTSKE
jgi:hypothetical protein